MSASLYGGLRKPVYVGICCLVFCLFSVGCTSTSSTSQEAQTVATAMFEAFNLHDWKKMSSYYADDAEFLDPSLGKNYVKQSRDATAAKYSELQHLFPDIRDDITEVHAAGESVTVQFTSRGTGADGTPFELPIVSVLTIRNGQIVKDATYYDLEIP